MGGHRRRCMCSTVDKQPHLCAASSCWTFGLWSTIVLGLIASRCAPLHFHGLLWCVVDDLVSTVVLLHYNRFIHEHILMVFSCWVTSGSRVCTFSSVHACMQQYVYQERTCMDCLSASLLQMSRTHVSYTYLHNIYSTVRRSSSGQS